VTSRAVREALGTAAEAVVAALAVEGEQAAFEELVRRRHASLRNLLRRLCGNAALADDLAQQTFVQAWTRIASLRAPAAFGGWLRQIAINTWLAQARLKAPTGAPLATDVEDAATADPSLALDLDRLLHRLSEGERTCIVLAYAEGLTHGEIAATTGWPLGTVKSHVLRGGARLREWWTDAP
jgi:RNA polymerase sigma factor (sigma-70 family)